MQTVGELLATMLDRAASSAGRQSYSRSLWRLKKSGLEKAVRAQTFKAFHAVTDWQRQMVDVAKRYLNDPDGAKSGAWLYIGGAVGCGKTHICTAVAGQLMIRETTRSSSPRTSSRSRPFPCCTSTTFSSRSRTVWEL